MSDSNLLFHYTSLEGFLNIIDTSCLWAGQLNFMNDYSEGRMFMDALEAAIERESSFSEISSAVVAKNVRNTIEEFCWLKTPRFTISFCEHQSEHEINNGLLSQWRGYAEGGVALAFNKVKLFEACANLQKETGWLHVLKPVIYGNTFEDISKKTEPGSLDLFNVLQFADTMRNGNAVDIAFEEKKFRPLIDAVIKIAPFIKDISFEAEHEFRLVIAPDYFENVKRLNEGLQTGNWRKSDLNVKFRVRGGKLSPYLEALRFKSNDIFREHSMPQGLISCLDKVIIGPIAKSAYNLLAAKALLSNRDIEVVDSKIPYV